MNYFTFLVFLAAMWLRVSSPDNVAQAYWLIALYALLGSVQAIQALSLSWFFSMLNPGLAPLAPSAPLGRYVVLFCAAISVLLHSGLYQTLRGKNSLLPMTLLLGVGLVGHAVVFSPFIDVSVLKALSWTIVMATLIAAWVGLAPAVRDSLAHQLFLGLTLLMLVSLPLLPLPVGYLRHGGGFQGALNHPQAFGLTMALLGAWAASRLFGQERPRLLTVGVLGACLILVVLSGARTAGFSLIIGLAVAVILAPTLSGRSLLATLPGLRHRGVRALVALALAGALGTGPLLSDRLGSYIAKRGPEVSLAGAYERSRGWLIKIMWRNITDKPLTGIGFGIGSVPRLMVVYKDPILGWPISAPIEKGVLPVAVLEELGVFGFLAVGVWVWMLIRRSAWGGVVPLAVALTALITNFGESTLFSPSGMGLLLLIILGWASSYGETVPR